MPTNEEQVNKIALKMGSVLIDSGMKMIASAFHLASVKVEGTEITLIISKYFSSVAIFHMDSLYYLVPKGQWNNLVFNDWVDTKKWLIDKRDCDNFANAFAANMSMFYELNSVGRVYGKLYGPNGDLIAWHYWNVIITSEKEIWFFEPQKDRFTEGKFQGGQILIAGNRYEPVSFMFG